MKYLKRRSLDNSLIDLLPDRVQGKKVEIELAPIPPFTKFYGVLRSKGGSGEMHLLRKLANELLVQNKKVFVCYKTYFEMEEFVGFEKRINLPSPLNRLIEINDLTSSEGAAINLDWTKVERVNQLFAAIKDVENCAVIFTVGTASGSPIGKRATQLSRFCEKVFVSVDSHVENSFLPARWLLSIENIDLSKFDFCWWHKINSRHLLRIFSAEELGRHSTEQLIKKILQAVNLKHDPLLIKA